MVLVLRNKAVHRDTENSRDGQKGGAMIVASPRDEDQRAFPIMLVGGNSLYQKGFKLILNTQPNAKGKATFFLHGCSTVEDFEAKLNELSEPQRQSVIIFLLDEGSEPASAIKNIDALKKVNPSSKIIVSSNSKNVDYINRCIEKGVHAYIPSDILENLLVDCVHMVAYGQMAFPSHIFHREFEAVPQQSGSCSIGKGNSPQSGIDDKEATILGCLASGMPNKEISRLTGLSDPATKMAVRKVLGKIGARNRVQAAVWAEKNGYSLEA